ncbi:MAG: GNAT family N-acetyltransferase [Gemmatimonadaceae bacterium]
MRRAAAGDAALLADLARSTFVDTFAADNTADDMRDYVASAFGEESQRAELADERNTVFLAERDGETVGYMVLRDGDVPSFVAPGDAIEIARLYAIRRLIGAGIGASLMQCALSEAASRGKQVIWLGVWERNVRAIAFYARWGFRDVGTQSFQLGSDVQQDRVMARAVAGA